MTEPPPPPAHPSSSVATFEDLYARHVPLLVGWVRLRTSGLRDRVIDPEDVVQETWTRAFTSFQRFDPARASFRSWVVGIAQHVLLETLRRHAGRDVAPERSEAAPGVSQCPAQMTSISRAAARAESQTRFIEYVDALPAEERELVVLRGLEQRPFADIARQQQSTVEAVAKRWERLLARLRERGIGRDLIEP